MKDKNYLSNEYHENRDLFYRNGKSYTKEDAKLWDSIKNLERAQELFDEYKDIFDDKD